VWPVHEAKFRIAAGSLKNSIAKPFGATLSGVSTIRSIGTKRLNSFKVMSVLSRAARPASDHVFEGCRRQLSTAAGKPEKIGLVQIFGSDVGRVGSQGFAVVAEVMLQERGKLRRQRKFEPRLGLGSIFRQSDCISTVGVKEIEADLEAKHVFKAQWPAGEEGENTRYARVSIPVEINITGGPSACLAGMPLQRSFPRYCGRSCCA
jgi:hypothetical protein